jgi:poly[(R)-3-hydroxyalkanoate] polymerase subunit PhaC
VTAVERIFEKLVERQLTAYGKRHAAWLLHQQRAWQRVLSLADVAHAAFATRVGTTPHDVVLRRGTLSLLRYRRATPATHSEPVLLCYALVNRPYILDLQPGKSVVEHYLERGFEVYLVDWGVPSLADRGLTLEDYVSKLLAGVVDFIQREHRVERLHLLGYCMGGTLSALFTALNPRSIRTLTLLAAPIDFAGRASLINLWTGRKYFDVDAFIDAHGNCPGWFLQLCFLYTKPVQNLLEKYIAFYEQMDDPRFMSSYLAMERWTNDNIPVAGETFRDFVKNLYQANQLVKREFHVGDRRVDLAQIDCPLLLLTAKNDHLVEPASTNSIKAHVASQDIKQMMIEAGHVGLVVSAKAHKTFWPEATRWLAERSQEVNHGRPN